MKGEASSSTFKPPLEKVVEVEERDSDAKSGGSGSGLRCPSFYGVKSYLHHFYEGGFKDPAVYEDDEYAYLLRPSKPRSRYCRPIVWKATVWIGINFLIFGIIGIFVSYCVPKRQNYQMSAGHLLILKDDAETFNENLEIVKLVGMLLFCLGGAVTIVGLLVPTFLWHYCDEGRRDDGFKIRVGVPSASGGTATGIAATVNAPGAVDEVAMAEGNTPLNMASPISPTTTVDSVQPERKKPESVVTQKGLKEMDKT